MDEGSPISYLLPIVLMILGGAFFAASETAFASANRIRMMSHAANGDKKAKRVLYILEHFDQALTTILVGNNLMHIGCASLSTLMATKIWGFGSVTAMTFVMTLVLFLIAETLPKRLAKAHSENLARTFSGPLLFLMRVISPVAFLFSKLTELVRRPFRKEGEEEPTVTEDEFHDLIETAAEEGALDEETTELVQNALDFSETAARDVMTPWNDTVVVKTGMRKEEIMAVIREAGYSRLPVVDNRGEVVGLLSVRKYLKACLAGNQRLHLRAVMDAVTFVEPDMPIDDILPLLSSRRTQTGVVREQGGVPLGLISVEDILEELVGEIYDEDDTEEAQA